MLFHPAAPRRAGHILFAAHLAAQPSRFPCVTCGFAIRRCGHHTLNGGTVKLSQRARQVDRFGRKVSAE